MNVEIEQIDVIRFLLFGSRRPKKSLKKRAESSWSTSKLEP